jgi:hypothetical protein
MVASPKLPLELPGRSAAISLVEPLTARGAPLQLAWSLFELLNFSPAAAGTGDDLVAKLTTKNQRIVTGVTYPKSGYSRVVSCVAYVDETSTHARGYTLPIGIRVWLLSVDVWFSPAGEVPGRRIETRILTGAGEPAGPGQILSWDNVLPLNFPDGPDKPWVQEGLLEHMSWNMCQLFEGKERRFGIWIKMSPMEQVLNVYASFQISEG